MAGNMIDERQLRPRRDRFHDRFQYLILVAQWEWNVGRLHRCPGQSSGFNQDVMTGIVVEIRRQQGIAAPKPD